MRFKNRVAVVTGAAAGIGRATALRLAEEGAMVVAGDLDLAGLGTLAASSAGAIRFMRCDVTSPEEIAALMDFAAVETGGIDVLVNNAGASGAIRRIDAVEAEEWDATMNLLLRSVAMGIRFAVPHMVGRKGAAIVNLSSIGGIDAGHGFTPYGVSKAAILQLTQCAAADLAQYGIRVNAICPGVILTDIFAGALGIESHQAEAIMKRIAPLAQPVARSGAAQDVSALVLYLASDAAGFITGTHMIVDGGASIGERHSWDPTCAQPLAGLQTAAQ